MTGLVRPGMTVIVIPGSTGDPDRFLQRDDARAVLLQGDMFVPVDLQDRIRVGDRGELLLAHPAHTDGRERGARERQRPGEPFVRKGPGYRAVIPAHGPVGAQARQERIRPEGRELPVQRPVVHRQHEHRHGVGDQQDRGHGDGLVVEELASEAVEEDQRDEHGAGREDGAEHRPAHLLRALHHRLAQGLAPLPARRDVVGKHDGVVHHHAHAQQQSGQGDDVDRQADGIEDEEGDHQRDRDRERHQQRRSEILHEEEDHHDVQQDGHQDVQEQVADGVVQQLGLVAGHREHHLRIVLAEMVQLLGDALLEVGHPGLALLDHGHHHGVAPVAAREARPGRLALHHAGDVLHLEDALPHLEVDIGDVFAGGGERVELDIVVILPVADREVGEVDVGCGDALLELSQRHAQARERLEVRDHEDLAVHPAAQVHHRHFRELLDALRDDILGEFAHPQEVASFVAERHVDVEGRDVRGAGLEDLGPVDARERAHRAVDHLVNLDIEQVDVLALFEREGHRGAAVLGLGADVLEVGDLHEALAQRPDDGVVELARRQLGRARLDGHVRDVHLRDQRHRQAADADEAQHHEDQQDHRDGDGTVQQLFQHRTTVSGPPWSRLRG